jgi:AcrR family transcriptional regulator
MTGDERRAQLLTTAREVFARQGFHGTSMEAVAEEAGITKPVLYQHFVSKHELYLELLDDMRQRLVSELDHVTPASGPEQRLTEGVQAFFRFVANNEAAFRILFEASASDPEVAKRVQAIREEIVERTMRVVKSHGRAGDAEVAAWAVVGMSELVSHWWLDHPSSRGTAGQVADQVARMAWHGISGPPAAG